MPENYDPFFIEEPTELCHVLWSWWVGVVSPDTPLPPPRHHKEGSIGELVFCQGRILGLFENNTSEVFVVEETRRAVRNVPVERPVQLALW